MACCRPGGECPGHSGHFPPRNAKAATRFFRKLLKGLQHVPRVLTSWLATRWPTDGGAAGGGRELVERGSERCPGCGVVTGLEVDVAGRGAEVTGAVVG